MECFPKYIGIGYIGLKTEKGSHDKFQRGDIMTRFQKDVFSVSRASHRRLWLGRMYQMRVD